MSRPSRKRFKKTHGPDFVENYDSSYEDSEPKCDYCLLTATCNPSGKSEELLVCKDCNAKAHPSCMDYSGELARRSRMSPWQCIDCKTCYICQDSEDADSMLFCDSCDKGYHMGCHRPKVLEKPVGKWVCQRCQEEMGIVDANSNDSVYSISATNATSTKKTCKTNDAASTNDMLPSKCTVDGASGLPTPCDSPIPDAQQNKHSYGMLFGIKLNSFLDDKENLSITGIPDATNWSIEDVEKYLCSVGFTDQAKSFREQEIDGRSLLLMKRNDVLTGLALKLGPALKIYNYVKQLQLKHLSDVADF